MPANSNLQAIRTKIRRLTRSPSTAQLSDDDIDQYINTFVQYDFPEHLRMFNLRGTFTFICNPFQDTYTTDTASYGTAVNAMQNPLYDFQNKYLTVHPPLFIAGFPSLFSQDRSQFYTIYPIVNNIMSIGITGDGATTSYTGIINSQQNQFNLPNQQLVVLLPGEVLFDSVGVNNQGVSLIDVPLIDDNTGNPTSFGNLYDPSSLPTVPPMFNADFNPNNNINYVTGAYTITFSAAPGVGQAINSQTVPLQASLPQAMLWYDNTFVLRPIPDQPYRINFEVYIRPTELLSTNPMQEPGLNEWWQFIAYGASKKVFEDRMDLDSVAMIMPEYKKQENLCLRRTIVQYTNDRTATIYTEQTANGAGFNGWGYGGGSF